MKKYILLFITALTGISVSYSQSAFDAYRFSKTDTKGTARFMSMGGAFTALGGDLSTISQNPAGIGVYRSHEIGLTMDVNVQHSSSNSNDLNHTKFLFNNIGGVATWKLNNPTFLNLNLGFTYNKAASFNRRYKGQINDIQTSMTNYIAGLTNSENISVDGLTTVEGSFDPYNMAYGDKYSPWLSILGYDSYLISFIENSGWAGQFTKGVTKGDGYFNVEETGHVDEYNISIGGNIKNVVYWGMDFGISDLNYNLQGIWGENLNNAYVGNNNHEMNINNSKWNINNLYSVNGSGFNYKLGFIVKPIQELRIGFAFHTPTWYSINESYIARVNYNYSGVNNPGSDYAVTNGNIPASNSYNLSTPWKLMVGVAGVIGNKFIVSADYEWTAFNKMKFSEANNYDNYGPYEPYDPYDPYFPYYSKAGDKAVPKKMSSGIYTATNKDIRTYYKNQHTFRIGVEYRVTPQLSIRAGYGFLTSPVKSEVKNNKINIFTSGTDPSYTVENETNYVSCGIGYKYQKFYVDLAYVYKNQSLDYHAFTPDLRSDIESPQAKITLDNHQIVLSAGFRF